MTQGLVPLRTRALHMLMDAGSWVSRDELNTLSTSPMAIDDAMADLVVAGLVEWRENVGYRLQASQVVRRAAQLQRQTGKPHAAAGMPGKGGYSVGIAQTVPDLGLVLFELEIPNPPPGPQAQQRFREQLTGLLNFKRGGSDAC